MKSIKKYDLFNPIPEEELGHSNVINRVDDYTPSQIPGLIYLDEFIDLATEQRLLNEINQQPWLSDIKRRVQHYGWRYDYRAHRVDYSMFLGKLPEWLDDIAKKLVRNNLIREEPDQVIVNEYLQGQGIAGHVDCSPCFGDTIISLSLASTCIMDFTCLETKHKIERVLNRRSVTAITGEARYNWTHGIAARIADKIEGRRVRREKRISLTFRKVII